MDEWTLRAAVQGLLCLKASNDWEHLGSVLGCAVFNAFVSDLEEMAECSLRKFPDDRTWKGAVSMLAYRDT